MGTSSREDLAAGSALTASDEKLRTEHLPLRSKSERVKGERDRDRDRERDRDRDGAHRSSHHRHKSSRSSKLADGDSNLTSSTSAAQRRSHRSVREKDGADRDRHRDRERDRERDKDRDRAKKTASLSDLVPELSRVGGSRVSLPYPTFSKAHSRESTRDDVSSPATKEADPLTPEPTDLGAGESRSSENLLNRKRSSRKENRPPSPPETDMSEEKRRSHTSTPRSGGRLSPAQDRPGSRTSGISRSSSKRDDRSKMSGKSSRVSSQATYIKTPIYDDDSTISDDRTAGARSAATSVAPKRSASKRDKSSDPPDVDDSPESVQDSSPKTPTTTAQFPPAMFSNEKRLPTPHLRVEEYGRPSPAVTPMTDLSPPPPPPPPPPPLNIQEVPRIDYLLQNGGLGHPISKNFLSAIPKQSASRPTNQPLTGPEAMFAPLFSILDQYQNVIHKQGSVAVATGHKSVARRLLDRLEDVFSRDLPEEGCACVMCDRTPEEHQGLGWGEVLERVGGRIDLPAWPPFDLASLGASAVDQLGELPPRPTSPVNLDPDIAEEFREHYLRQSKKVRSAVDKWMETCAEAPAPPPTEVDDETLTFAILTSLEPEERPYFNALLSGEQEVTHTVRAPTPNVRKPRVDFIVKCGLSLQRLYRLSQAPRDAETAMYLVKNPFHHDLLVTITDISPQEWEILTSGRFDGFLWSGAEGDDGTTPTAENPGSRGPTPANGFFSPPPSRGATVSGMGFQQTPGLGTSRNTTPFSGVYSRGTTPASFVSLSSSAGPMHSRQAVSHDEEVEMAVLAEVEREIYQGMEALEDAFEKLHHRAEMVRNALRQRNAGLMMSMQSRRAGGGIDVLPQLSGDSSQGGYARPPWAGGDEESESDWGGDDAESLAPDDSASNISSSRHRRPKRRTERRTPAPIEEEDEN